MKTLTKPQVRTLVSLAVDGPSPSPCSGRTIDVLLTAGLVSWNPLTMRYRITAAGVAALETLNLL